LLINADRNQRVPSICEKGSGKMPLFLVSPVYTKRADALPGYERENIRKAIDMILFLLMMQGIFNFYIMNYFFVKDHV
jgi:hypothetical protein